MWARIEWTYTTEIAGANRASRVSGQHVHCVTPTPPLPDGASSTVHTFLLFFSYSLVRIFLLDSYGHFPAISVSIVMLFVKIVKRYEIKLALRHQSFANAFYNRLDISSPTNCNKKRG